MCARLRNPFCPIERLYLATEDLILGCIASVLLSAWANAEESIAAACPCGNHDGRGDDA